MALLATVASAALGFQAPNIWLHNTATKREAEMRLRYAAGELSYDVQGIRKLIEGG